MFKAIFTLHLSNGWYQGRLWADYDLIDPLNLPVREREPLDAAKASRGRADRVQQSACVFSVHGKRVGYVSVYITPTAARCRRAAARTLIPFKIRSRWEANRELQG